MTKVENKKPSFIKLAKASNTTMLTKTEIDRIMADPTKRILITSEEKVKSTDPGEQPKTYRGQWRFVDGKAVKDGFGKIRWPDGSYYEGQFEVDKM